MNNEGVVRASHGGMVSANDTAPDTDRRGDSRYRTVYRVAPVRSAHDCGLARVRNISDGGMAIDIGFPVCLGDQITLALSDALILSGRVAWTNGDECGVKFDQAIDSVTALRESAEAARSPNARAPRLQLNRPAQAITEDGPRMVQVCDVSQRGMKIAHDGSFTPGLRVKVALGSGIERRGVVRWAQDGLAGLLLTDTFTPHELGSVSAL